MERSGLFPSHQYRKGVDTCDALLDIVCTLQLDFSAAFDRVSHSGLLFRLRDAGIGGTILEVLGDFLSERTQMVKLDDARRSVVNVGSDVPQGSVLGPLLFLLYIRDLPPLFENAEKKKRHSTFVASVSSSCERPAIAASLNRDLVRINKWCGRWGMLINSAKTYGMMISRSRTAWPTFPDLFVGGSILKMVGEMKILGVVMNSKLTFERPVRSVGTSASRRIGILRKTRSVVRDNNSIVSCSFWSFILSVLEYCSFLYHLYISLSFLPLFYFVGLRWRGGLWNFTHREIF